AVLAAVTLAAQLTDPYEVLQKNFEALGGLDKLKAEQSSYLEAELDLVGTGLKGTVKVWQEMPQRKREEVDLVVFRSTEGDNGKYAWEADANDKVRIVKDESSLARREVERLLHLYRYADPSAPEFTLELKGIDTVGTTACYVLRIANTINSDIRVVYIDASSFLLVKSVDTHPDEEIETLYSDYRDIDGVLHPFRQEMTVLPNNQVIALTVTEFQVNPEIDIALFEPPQEVADFRIVDSVAAANVPFEFIENHIFLPVTINCERRLWVLDNGAGVTVLDRAYAEELGLQPEGQLPGSGIGNTVEFGFVELPEYSLPGLEFSSQRVAVFDMTDLKKKMGLDVVGILGYDFLSRFVTRIDYAGERLSFFDPAAFAYRGSGVVLDAPLEEHDHTVPMAVDGIYNGQWRLDTGAGGCSFHQRYAAEHDLLKWPGVERLATGAGGTLENRVCRFAEIEFAGFKVPDPLVTVTTEESEGAFTWSDKVGNIGNSLLRNFVIWLDYERQQVIVERGAQFGQEFLIDASGLQLLADTDSTAEIYFVAPGTPAEKAGLQIGDRLLTINSIPIVRLDGLNALRTLLREKSGTEYSLSYLRNGSLKSCKLKLRKLL
ncbi:MAG: aspartyl protease family protein, partial [bacterium]